MQIQDGWEYLCCACENGTQEENIIKLKQAEGWLLQTPFDNGRGFTPEFKRRLFHAPGWYVVIMDHNAPWNSGANEVGPYRTEEEAREKNGIFTIVSIKKYDIDKPWDYAGRFDRISDRM